MKKEAYTLIELIVVISIISILLLIALPNFSIIEEYKVKTEVNNIVTDINKCRNLAITSKKPSEISFEQPGQYYYSCGDFISDTITYSDNLKITHSNISSFKFNSRGIPTMGGSGTLVFSSGSQLYRVSVTPVTGRVNLYKGD